MKGKLGDTAIHKQAVMPANYSVDTERPAPHSWSAGRVLFLIVFMGASVPRHLNLGPRLEEEAEEIAMRDKHSASVAAELVTERERQITEKNHTHFADDNINLPGSLALGAASYAASAGRIRSDVGMIAARLWPWSQQTWKPKSPRDDLVRAGALIIAEIERLDRAANVGPPVSSAPVVAADDEGSGP